MASGNQPGGILLILTKSQKLSKSVNRMFMKYIKVIIRDLLSILGYQVDYFVKKSTFCSKWTPEISPVASPRSWEKLKIVKKVQSAWLWSIVVKYRYRLSKSPNVTKMPYSPIFSIVFHSKTMEKLEIHSFWWMHAFQILKISQLTLKVMGIIGQSVIGCTDVAFTFVF